MAFLTINRCCCLSLHTAGIVIGVLGALLPLMQTIHYLARLNHYNQVEDEGEEPNGYYDKLKTDIYFVLVASIAYLVTCIMLIVGTIKNSHFMLLPWLIINVAVLVLCIPFMLAFYYFAGVRGTSKDRLQIIVAVSLFVGIFFWMWLAVYSLFERIRAKNNEIILRENQKKLINVPARHQVVQYNA